MHIAIDCKILTRHRTGIGRYLFEMIQALQELDQGNRYTLIAPYPIDIPLTNAQWKIHVAPSRFRGVVWQQVVLPQAVKNLSCDLLWSPDSLCPVTLSPHCPIVTTLHDLTFKRYPETMPWRQRLIMKLLFKKTLQASHHIVAISPFTQQELRTLYSESLTSRCSVIPNGYRPLTVGQDGALSSDESPYILAVGSVEPRKNLPRLLQAMEMLASSYPTMKLLLVGASGWHTGPFFKAMQVSPIKDRVQLKGFVEDQDLAHLYKQCQLFVFPSLYEGFGLPVLEALAQKAPIVCSQKSPMEDILGQAAYYCDPLDVSSIAAAIKQALQKGKNYTDAQRTEILATYTWQKSATALLSLFARVSTPPSEVL